MFVFTNNGKIVNLKNVCNVNVISERNRIVFNMNYNITLPTNDTKLISDYVYWDANTNIAFEENLDTLFENQYFENEFISSCNMKCFINSKEISSIKFISERKRIIFNMSHSVSFVNRHGERNITSEFIYVDCESDGEFDEYKQMVLDFLGD